MRNHDPHLSDAQHHYEPNAQHQYGAYQQPPGMPRRDLLKGFAAGLAVIAGGGAAIPLIQSMKPSLDVESLRTVEVDLSGIKEGEMKVVEWQGKPIFVVHRNAEQIKLAAKSEGVKEKQADSERAKKPEWLIAIGVCTHLGCIPMWKGEGETAWHCPCHGSQYDYSARIIRGPAPKNLEIPEYEFLSDTKVKLGKEV